MDFSLRSTVKSLETLLKIFAHACCAASTASNNVVGACVIDINSLGHMPMAHTVQFIRSLLSPGPPLSHPQVDA